MKASRARPESPRSILVLKPSSFGDIIHALPAVERLRARWPDSRISWLVNPEWAPLLRGNPVVDEVLLFPRQDFRGWRGWLRARRWLREQIKGRQPDLAVDYQGLLRTAVIGRLAGARYIAGLADAREGAGWLYDETVAIPRGVPHAVERYLALSDVVTAPGAVGPLKPGSSGKLQFPLPVGVPIVEAHQIESECVVLHPFARGAGKSLTVAQTQAICARLMPRQVVVVGSWAGDAFSLPPNGIDLLNQTSLLQLLWLLGRARFVISVDSGPTHLAAALEKPLVAIHSWSDPRRVGPYRPDAWVLKNGALLRVRELGSCDERFFAQPPGEMLPAAQLDAICRLATSS